MQRLPRVYRPHIWVARVRALAAINAVWLKQQGHLFHWTPVFLGLGVALYFALPVEPPMWFLWTSACAALPLVLAGRWLGIYWGPFLIAAALVASGYALAGAEARAKAAPVLSGRYYGPLQGRIIEIDRSGTGAPRLLLDQVVLDRRAAPATVRVSLHGPQDWLQPALGQTVMMTAHLSPPSGPVEPGGFDFQRHAWFERLGGVGYTRNPALLLYDAPEEMALTGLRRDLVARIRRAIHGQTGAVAAALLAGDRSGVALETVAALRDSNLAHLLAISGLHMGLLAGLVYGLVRRLLVLVPAWALYLPTKKIAAIAALICAAAYLAISGASVATQRAFVMVAVGLCAVLADRQVISLRSVAMAALVLLVLQPHALVGPGFQMSFAATTGLIAGFEVMRPLQQRIPSKVLRVILMTVLSSAMAGAATAPFAAAHFNRLTDYGLVANLMATPLMGTLIMPAGILGVCLMPFGLEWIGFVPMGWGIDWVLAVASGVSGLPSAVTPVPSPDVASFAVMTAGGLILCLWQGRTRFAGALLFLVAVALWQSVSRPEGLVSDDGRLVGILGAQGRVLSQPKGAGFVAQVWLENDGDPADQPSAAARAGWQRNADGLLEWQAGEWQVVSLRGRKEAKGIETCTGKVWIISDQPLPKDIAKGDCKTTTVDDLRHSGALAFRITGGELLITSSRDITGDRLWNIRQRKGPDNGPQADQ